MEVVCHCVGEGEEGVGADEGEGVGVCVEVDFCGRVRVDRNQLLGGLKGVSGGGASTDQDRLPKPIHD